MVLMIVFAVLFCGCFEIAWGMINLDIVAMVSGMSFSAMGLYMLIGFFVNDDDDDNDDSVQ